MFKEVRDQLSVMPGVIVSVVLFMHRIDHMLSGTQAAIAIKLFGDNLMNRRVAQDIKGAISGGRRTC